MKKNRMAASVAALLLLAIPLSSCGGGQAPATETDTAEEVVTIPPIRIPDEPDERTFTDLSLYTNHLRSLTAESTPSPAEDFTYEVSADGGVTITGYVGDASAEEDSDVDVVVVIPDTIEGATVTAIAEGAFAEHTAIDRMFIPDSITAIGFGAFKGCKSLVSLRTPVYTCEDAPYFGALFGAETLEASGYSVPTGLSTLILTAGETIPESGFYACRNLKVIALPDTLTEIGDFAFYNCTSLAYVAAQNTALTAVGRNAFTNCESLLGLHLPATVETMEIAMLEGCRSLESLTLPFVGGGRGESASDTAYLGYLFGAEDYTFSAGFIPGALLSVTLLEGCGDIPANAFFECASIREIHLPAGVVSIGRRAFYGCEGLAELTLPDTVTTLGDDALHGCIRLTSFDGGAGLSKLGIQCFMDCVSLETVTLPDGVTHLSNACFSGCISLSSLTADGVRSRGSQVFRHCDKLEGSTWTAQSVPAN